MKRQLRNLEGRLREVLIDPLQKRGQDRTEPLDVWTDVQKHVRAQITLSISGVPIFPNRHVTIVVGAEDESERHRLEASLSATELRAAIMEFLAGEGCRPPEGFWVSIDIVPRGGGLPGLEVRFDNEGIAGTTVNRAAVLRVLSGQANTSELKISARRINLGRRERLTDEEGNSLRHNDLAFTEISNGVNETVSRRHAHLDFDEKSGGYRLFRDSRSAEMSVMSQGATIVDVPLSGPGIVLKSGDIIRLGKAEIEFHS